MAKPRPAVAFIDESTRGTRYLLACSLVEVRHLAETRSSVAAFVLVDRERVHFVKESPRRRRELLGSFNRLAQRTYVNVCVMNASISAHTARAACLTAFVRMLQLLDVARVVVESRHAMDVDDVRTIAAARQPSPRLTYEHLEPAHEPLLWLPDAYAWAVGAGGDWSTRAAAGVERIRRIVP